MPWYHIHQSANARRDLKLLVEGLWEDSAQVGKSSKDLHLLSLLTLIRLLLPYSYSSVFKKAKAFTPYIYSIAAGLIAPVTTQLLLIGIFIANTYYCTHLWHLRLV